MSTDVAPPNALRLRMRRGRVVFPARRPAALVIPLALTTEAAAAWFWFASVPIWWAVAVAPALALLLTGVILRPSLELTREGVVQRQYPFASLTRWEVIDRFAITRAGNRVLLAYKLIDGVPPPRRQPAAALLRAAAQPFDGGYFADSIAADPGELLATVDAYLRDPALRHTLPLARLPARG